MTISDKTLRLISSPCWNGKADEEAFTAAAAEATALPCPFCGGEGQAAAQRLIMYHAITVTCRECGAQTRPFITGTDETGRNYSAQEQLAQAVNAWNRRG